MYLLNQYAYIIIEHIIEQYLDNHSKNGKPELGEQVTVCCSEEKDGGFQLLFKYTIKANCMDLREQL